jgi:hypothetical protein
MKYLKLFESFEQPEGIGGETFWESEIDGETIRITLNDVLNYLDNSFEIDPNEIKHLLIDVERDPKRIDSVDLKYPIILLKKNGQFVSILDGQHRIVKALKDGVSINARILDLDSAPDTFEKVLA